MAPQTRTQRTIRDMLDTPRFIGGGDGRLDDEITADLARLGDLTDEELQALEARLVEAAQAQAEGDQDVEVLGEIRDAVATVRAEATQRATANAEREQQVAELMSEIAPEASDAGDGDEGTGDGDGDGDAGSDDADAGDGDGDATPAEATPAEGDGDATPTTSGGEGEGETEQPQAQAAGAANAATPPGAMNSRRSRRATPPTRGNRDHLSIVAAAGTPHVRDGHRYDSLVAAAEAMIRRQSTFVGQAANDELVPVLQILHDYPESRRLTGDVARDQALIAAVTAPEAIIAAGGFCAPVAPRYELPNISVALRPVRDSLAQFQATRGGIVNVPATPFRDLAGGVTVWTHENDANPSDPTTKPCVRVECNDAVETFIDAIVACVTFGNLGARAWPEQVADAMRSIMAYQARIAERKLLDSIDAASTAVTSGEVLSATRDILATLDRVTAYYRNVHRTDPNLPLRVILPSWVRNLIRTDLARQLPGDDSLNTADAEIDGFFSSRNLNVTYALEGATGADEDFTVQGDGPLQGWPGGAGAVHTVVARVFHEGAHLFLDGGELDLGLVRDSTLNARNDYNMFSETFEATAMVGLESIRLEMNVCPDGSTSGAVDIAPCGTGS